MHLHHLIELLARLLELLFVIVGIGAHGGHGVRTGFGADGVAEYSILVLDFNVDGVVLATSNHPIGQRSL